MLLALEGQLWGEGVEDMPEVHHATGYGAPDQRCWGRQLRLVNKGSQGLGVTKTALTIKIKLKSIK